ncbi:MAG: hypothetical protein WC833_08610 [Bacteroidales bacterium]|jgi:hypothetical protein
MEIHEFDPVIYPYKLWIIIDKKPTLISDKFNEYDGTPIEFIDRDTNRTAAFTMPVIRKEKPNYGVIIFFRSKRSMSSYELVAHESSHAAKFLFEHISAGIKEHEPFEYVIGWIAGCCEKVKKNKI